MEKINIINEVVDRVHQKKSLGVVIRNITDNISIVKSEYDLIDTIMIFKNKQSQITKISLYGKDFVFSLQDLINHLGSCYKYNYNFRDNITVFTFGDICSKNYYMFNIDDKLEIIDKNIFITKPNGTKTAHKVNSPIFNKVNIKFNL